MEAARLLLVDDEENVLLTLAAVLRQGGYDVTAASTASDALEAIKDNRFDVIITDLRMEDDASGLALLRAARDMDPHTVAIVLTGYGSFPSAVEALQAGAFDYLTKPSDLDQLKQSIARGLEKRQADSAVLAAQRAEVAQAQAQLSAREATLRADVSTALAERASPREILDKCAEALVKHLDAAYARIWLVNVEANHLELLGTAGASAVSGPLTEVTMPLGRWKVGRAIAERRPAFSDDLASDPEFSNPDWAKREGMTSFACYPLVLEDRCIGAIVLFKRSPFAQQTLDAMQPIAAAIAQGIDRRRAEQERDRLLVAEREARARAEAAERRLEQIVESLPEGVFVVDPDGRPLLLNAAARAIAGPPQPLHGRAEESMWRIDGTPLQTEHSPLGRAITYGETIQSEQLLLLNSETKERVPILANAAPIHDAEGKLLGGVAVFQDISALKEFEQQKNDFLAAAAHDLKAPLTTIKGLVQLLQRQLANGQASTATLDTNLSSIDAAATRMTGLIDELLDVSQLDMSQDIDLMFRQVDLVKLAQEVIAEQQRACETHTLRMRSEVPALVGSWDPQRIERALDNLLSNAIKYSPPGSEVLLLVRPEEHNRRHWGAVSITDQGVGIPGADLPRIFDRYRRGANVRGRIAGTGIGLAYVNEIAQRHGGAVSVQSQEGRGSTFTLRLPLD